MDDGHPVYVGGPPGWRFSKHVRFSISRLLETLPLEDNHPVHGEPRRGGDLGKQVRFYICGVTGILP